MRNVFDQYESPENRVTHALMTALHHDRSLLNDFLSEIAPPMPAHNAADIEIAVQHLPGRPADADEESAARRGIPDAWLTDGDDWCLMVECKLLTQVDHDQLERHRAAAQRLNFYEPRILVIGARPYDRPLAVDGHFVEWSAVYRWLVGHAGAREWARRTAEYFEVLEARMVEKERLSSGCLTTFTGIPFGKESPFTYREGKRLLRLATAELRKRPELVEKLGVAADLPGRTGIRDDPEAVWDVLRFEKSRKFKEFSEWPHLTLGIRPGALEAMVTLPHNARGRLPSLDRDRFERVVRDVLERVEPLLQHCPGVQPRMRAQQRHWPTRSAPPVLDAVIDVDLRVLDGDGQVKVQPQWLHAAHAAFANKKANIELQIGVCFPYQSCQAVRSAAILDHVAEAWLACCPMLEAVAHR